MRLLSKHPCTSTVWHLHPDSLYSAVLFKTGFFGVSALQAHAEVCTTLLGQQSVQVLRWI